jgi:hypothetical protein
MALAARWRVTLIYVAVMVTDATFIAIVRHA